MHPLSDTLSLLIYNILGDLCFCCNIRGLTSSFLMMAPSILIIIILFLLNLYPTSIVSDCLGGVGVGVDLAFPGFSFQQQTFFYVMIPIMGLKIDI